MLFTPHGHPWSPYVTVTVHLAMWLRVVALQLLWAELSPAWVGRCQGLDLNCPQQAHALNARSPDFGATWKAAEPLGGGAKLLGVEHGGEERGEH